MSVCRGSEEGNSVFQGRSFEVEELTEHSFKDIDIALFSAGGSIR